MALLSIAAMGALAAPACAPDIALPEADLILRNGRVYTLAWDEPRLDGGPAGNAPYGPDGWHPDASAVAVGGGAILYVGDDDGADAYATGHTRLVDLQGATVLPGLVDAHTHVRNLGATLQQVDLVGAADEAEAGARVAARADTVPPGEWIIGYGWDDGAWADDYPDKELLSRQVPDHPVLMRGLHGFAVWGNQAALDAAGITASTPDPEGGRIERGAGGEPTGLLRDRATLLLTDAVPPPDVGHIEGRFEVGLAAMAAAGYTTVHEAGVDGPALRALENMAAGGHLPLRVYAMLAASDEPLLRRWAEWGPDTDGNDHLIVRSVKAFYDGALGSRGAWLLEDYADRPGERGLGGAPYGFDEELIAAMIGAGFQANIHAIGDAATRETLDFFARALQRYPAAAGLRHRIEHAQVVAPADFARFRSLGITASMQPGHAVEDKAWALERLGPERVRGAYAWRTMRRRGVPVVFSSDLPGSAHDIFYGLHAAITRRDRDGQPPGGWYPEQRMSPEEAVRGYTSWAARSALTESSAGALIAGLWGDITVLSIDPLVVGTGAPERLLEGRVVMTIVDGQVVYEAR